MRETHIRCRCLAPLHNVDYVTPPLVALSFKKVYRHRILLAKPANDRSLQYGSDLRAVQDYLSNIDLEAIVEEVLADVAVPV